MFMTLSHALLGSAHSAQRNLSRVPPVTTRTQMKTEDGELYESSCGRKEYSERQAEPLTHMPMCADSHICIYNCVKKENQDFINIDFFSNSLLFNSNNLLKKFNLISYKILHLIFSDHPILHLYDIFSPGIVFFPPQNDESCAK